jgi:D-lactate dehydrogenase
VKAVFFAIEDWEREYFRSQLKDCTLAFEDKPLDEKLAARHADADIICPFIYSRVTPAILERMPRLRLIATMSTGFDHIDVKACAARGITVCNVPTYGENTVAEHTFALLLAISRRIPESVERTRRRRFNLDGLRGFDLKGKTFGVIGTGRIGSHAIKIAKGFDMQVLAFDPRPNEELAHLIGFSYAKDLDDLLARSDVISLHAPLNEKTRHLISKSNIGRIKRGAVLINTARGGLIETEALITALQEGILAAAGLDVLEEEGLIKEEKQLLGRKDAELRKALEQHVLLSMDNVLITPHNAFNSTEALRRILETTVDNIRAFEAGKPVKA